MPRSNKKQKMSTANVFSVEVKNAPEVPGEGKPRRHPLVADADQLPVFYNPEVRTLYENFQAGLKASGSKPFLGFRPFDAEGKAGPYSWITYDETWARIKNVGAAIAASDLQANDCVGIFSPNRVEWVVAAEACNAYSFVSVPLYDTLGKEAIQHIVNETKLKLIFVVKEKAKALVEIIGSLPSLKTVVFINGDAPELREKLVAASIAVHTFEEFETLGQGKPVDVRPPAHTDIATICYTSGTTGLPKGAVILHQNLICGAGSALQLGDNGYFRKFTSEDVHISYLPLAHMLERIVLTFLIGLGARLGFYQGDPTKLVDDLGALKPTLFISVPRILNRVHDRIWATVKAAGGVKRMLFETALNAKKEGLKQGHLTHWLWDRLVFNKIRDRLGGNVKAILTGSAPIAPDVLDFLRVCFSCEVYEGYGQTENCAIASIANLGDYTSGHVGSMYPCVEIKLVDVPDMNYTSKDVPHPRGEICTRGANNFKEYYLSPDKTAETMDADGWLHSGDIGMWDEQGRLKIIDRKKNIFKLAQGEYIAPEKIENILVKNDYVAQIFVHGDSLQAELVAIVIPDEEPLLAWIKAQGIENITTLEQAVKLDQVKKLILEQLNASGKAGGLKGFEMVRAVHLEHVPFTVENDFLTPTQKLKRPVAAKHYAAQIAEMYAALNKAAAEKPEK